MHLVLIFFLFVCSQDVLSQDSQKNTKEEKMEALLRKASKNIQAESANSFRYINEALKYKEEFTEKQILQLYKIAATAYFHQQSYLFSLEYYYKSLEIQKRIDPTGAHFVYNNIACVYMQLGNVEKSRYYLNKSLEGLKESIANGNLKEKNVEAFLVYSNLAILEMENKNYPKALEMLYIYEKHSIRIKDTVGVILTYQNLSNVYNNLNQIDSSKFYSQKGILLAKNSAKTEDLASLYYWRGFNNANKNKDTATYYLQKSYDLAVKKNLQEIKLSSSKALADVFEEKSDFKRSNHYLRIANSLSEENLTLQNKKKLKLLEFENEQKIIEQQQLAETQKRENVLIFAFILLVPICAIIFLMYRLQRTKAKKRKIENELLTQKMEVKNKELAGNAIQMMQVTEIMDATHKELNQLKTITDKSANTMLSQIISDLKKGNGSFNKKEFEKIFVETDEEFYKKLLKKYPTLTKNEIRLCAFAKMNFSTKEISAITQQSNNSILVARYRLRRKIGVKEGQSLTNFLKSL